MNKTTTNTWRRLWLMPLCIAVLSLTGLLSALSGDGFWDVLSWATLGVPCLVGMYYLIRGLRK